MIISLAMTSDMVEFMKLYDKPEHKKHGKCKVSHFEIGKLLKCQIATDRYGNKYYRHLTTCIRENLVLEKDYIIKPKIKNQQGQRTWFLTKEALYVLAMLLRGARAYREQLVLNEKLQADQSTYFRQLFA